MLIETLRRWTLSDRPLGIFRHRIRHAYRLALRQRRQLRAFSLRPLPGATVQDLVQKFYATPKNIVERGRRAIKP